MSRKRLPARLWLRPADHDRSPTWIILDGGKQYRTGCGPDARKDAESRLVEHIAAKHAPAAQLARHPSQVSIADVLSVYLDEVVPKQARPAKVASRIGRLLDWWGSKKLSDVGPGTCRDYTAKGRRGGSRRDLEDLRAAINHHAKRELHKGYVEVELPAKGQARAIWLTRNEVARLVWACWRHGRAVRLPKGRLSGMVIDSEWHDLRHIARFILMAYTPVQDPGLYLRRPSTRGQTVAFLIWKTAFSTASQKVRRRRTSVSLQHQSRHGFWRTFGGGVTKGSWLNTQ